MLKECITETICNFFCNNFDKFYDIEAEKEQQQVITAICRHALKQKADKIGLDSITKMSSTMLCVAVKDGKAVVCHIGDGVIGALTDDGVKIVSKPDNGEFASTTYFIASSVASEHLRIQKFPLNGEHAFFMMSDGVSEYVYNENSGEFNNGALKMSLMAFEKSGNESLAKTIDEFMIKKTPHRMTAHLFAFRSQTLFRRHLLHKRKKRTHPKPIHQSAPRTIQIPNMILHT